MVFELHSFSLPVYSTKLNLTRKLFLNFWYMIITHPDLIYSLRKKWVLKSFWVLFLTTKFPQFWILWQKNLQKHSVYILCILRFCKVSKNKKLKKNFREFEKSNDCKRWEVFTLEVGVDMKSICRGAYLSMQNWDTVLKSTKFKIWHKSLWPY